MRKIFRKISVKSAVMYCCFHEKFLFLKCLTNAPYEFWISGLDVYSCELHLWHRPTKCQWTSIDIKNFYDFSQRIPLSWQITRLFEIPSKVMKIVAWNMLFLPFFRMKISENNGFKEIYGSTPLAKVRRIKSSIGPFTPLLLWHISRKSLSLYIQSRTIIVKHNYWMVWKFIRYSHSKDSPQGVSCYCKIF